MDVMMDNMTNVVGTLLLVLIIVQLKVNGTVDAIEESIAQVTPKQVDELKQQAAKTASQGQLLEADWKKRSAGEDKIYAELKARKEDLKRYETTLSEKGVKLLDVGQVEQQLAEKRKLADEKKREMSRLIDERENLKGLLDKTPVPAPPPPKVVNVPAARPIPSGVTQLRVLVANQRLYFLSDAVFRDQVLQEIDRNKRTLVKRIAPGRDGKVSAVYDHAKTAALLTARKFSDASFELKFPVVRTADRLRLELWPKPNGGEAGDQLEAPNSDFRVTLTRLRTQPKVILWFMVYRDSIETYLVARDMCNRFGVPSGWEFYWAPYYAEHLSAIEVERLQAPPPQPSAGASQSSPVAIPAPKRTLD